MGIRGRIMGLLVVLLGGGGVLGVGAMMLKADQDAAVATYGETTVNICKGTFDAEMRGSLPEDAKVVFIDSKTSTIYKSYQDKLSSADAATGKDNVTHVGCLKSVDEFHSSDSYGSTGKYTCKRYTRNMEVAIFDVKTGKQVAFRVVEGTNPPECPDKTDKSLTKYGNPPESAEVFSKIGLN